MVNLLADFVVRFNEGLGKNMQSVYVPYSHTVVSVVRLMLTYNCINSYNIVACPKNTSLRIKIVYLYVENTSFIKKLELVSKPGLRIYWGANDLAQHYSRNNFQGFYIMSTPVGLCSSNELISAFILKKPVSGEALLKVNF